MAKVCEICGKGSLRGNRVSRLGKRALARRVKGRTTVHLQPNLQYKAMNGVRTLVCTGCIRTQSKKLAAATA